MDDEREAWLWSISPCIRTSTALVWFPDPSTHKIRACAYYDALAKRRVLYPNAGPGILISVGEPLVLSGC